MVDFFSGIADVMTTRSDLVVMVVKSIVSFISLVPSWLSFLTSSLLYLPGIILPFVMFGLILTVIFFIIGKQSG